MVPRKRGFVFKFCLRRASETGRSSTHTFFLIYLREGGRVPRRRPIVFGYIALTIFGMRHEQKRFQQDLQYFSRVCTLGTILYCRYSSNSSSERIIFLTIDTIKSSDSNIGKAFGIQVFEKSFLANHANERTRRNLWRRLYVLLTRSRCA